MKRSLPALTFFSVCSGKGDACMYAAPMHEVHIHVYLIMLFHPMDVKLGVMPLMTDLGPSPRDAV